MNDLNDENSEAREEVDMGDGVLFRLCWNSVICVVNSSVIDDKVSLMESIMRGELLCSDLNKVKANFIRRTLPLGKVIYINILCIEILKIRL